MLEPHKNIFITGTDTNIGKTIVACSILFKMNQQKRQAIGVKPISTGAKIINHQYQQQDTLALQEYSKIPIEHNQSNPWCFEPAISPHIAANYCKKEIKIADVRDHLYVLQQNCTISRIVVKALQTISTKAEVLNVTLITTSEIGF